LALAERLQKLHVIEGKANSDLGAPRQPSASPNGNGNGNGNGHRSTDDHHAPRLSYPQIPRTFVDDLSELNVHNTSTPAWLFFEKTAASVFGEAAQFARQLAQTE
jgi:hypothetical protein